jgi:hypothetical protein
MPSTSELLKEYIMLSLIRLLEKCGWQVGHRDCSTIRPLEEWTPDDRATLIRAYQPRCSTRRFLLISMLV